MKCKKCGYRAKDIAHMAKHYRKMHPLVMSKRGPTRLRAAAARSKTGYCPKCGRRL